MPDEELVSRILAGEVELYEEIMRRHNRRLYRAIRAILRDDAETEDVMQDAYVRAYANLAQFAGNAKFSTWLTRIAVHEALARLRKRGRWEQADMEPHRSSEPDPERQAGAAEIRAELESAVDALPDNYRVPLMLHYVEGLPAAEVADALGITAENAKVRLHRARRMLKESLADRLGGVLVGAFPFEAPRCDRVVAGVMARIRGAGARPAAGA
jgi:RNA polymerase sigma-70 factor (ECF subfamily)